MEYLLLILGFILLIKGADFFVDGSSNIAKSFGIPSVIIGLTLVAFGTSMPEASVSITALINNSDSLSLSNIIGSNIFNLFVVLGLTAIFTNIDAPKDVVMKDYVLSIYSIIILLAFIVMNYILKDELLFSRLGGLTLLIILGIYLFKLIKNTTSSEGIIKSDFKIKDIIMLSIGLLAIVLGGDLTVDAATTIASNIGISERVIGLTVVALGTSLPELCTSLVALYKGENDIALGNVIGSNLFNVLFILGLGGLVSPILVTIPSVIDLIILIIGCILVYVFIFRDFKINKKEGITMVMFYLCYFIYLFLR